MWRGLMVTQLSPVIMTNGFTIRTDVEGHLPPSYKNIQRNTEVLSRRKWRDRHAVVNTYLRLNIGEASALYYHLCIVSVDIQRNT
jgi:hypothetical protein